MKLFNRICLIRSFIFVIFYINSQSNISLYKFFFSPNSAGDEQEITIKNPGTFPIEIYNLEFDSIYLEEENVSIS